MKKKSNEILNLSPDQTDALLSDPAYFSAQVSSFFGFYMTFFPHYQTLEPAVFHKELVETLGDSTNKLLNIIGFRGSAKSTIASVAFPIWAALTRQSPFILVCGDTFLQAKMYLANIRHELESNEMILAVYGSMKSDAEWGATSIILKNGVHILARSRGQKVRGLRHNEHRPSLCVIDDPEDRQWVEHKENRDKTEKWLTGEIMPAMQERIGRIIVIGNLLHSDCLTARLKNHSEFETLEYPLLDPGGNILWPAKFSSQEQIEKLRREVGDTAFMREYLLKVIPDEGQEVKPDWIQYYDVLPPQEQVISKSIGIDLAISKADTADYTAMVTATVAKDPKTGDVFTYIRPNPINRRFSFLETINQCKSLSQTEGGSAVFFVEDVAYQKAAIEELERVPLNVRSIRPGSDKRARLRAVASQIQSGKVLFPKTGCEDLINQLLYFGVESHDDLADAFVYSVMGAIEMGSRRPGMSWG